MKAQLRFLGGFLRHPFTTGSVAPSSRALARMMVRDMGVDRARMVVELGPGTGAFTGTIEESLGPEATFLALELNPRFTALLRERGFTRAQIIQDSAENLREHLNRHGRSHADVILSGLPWASFGPDLQRRILSAVVDCLPSCGRFATFAYIHAAWFPSARKLQRYLREHFASVETSPLVWGNVPPAFVYHCRK